MCGLFHNAQLWKPYEAHAQMWLSDDLFSCSDEICFFLFPNVPAFFFVDNLCHVPLYSVLFILGVRCVLLFWTLMFPQFLCCVFM